MNGNEREEELRYSADLPQIGSARPPGGGEVVRVRDVLVVPGNPGADFGDVEPTDLATFPAFDLVEGRQDPEPIELGRGLILAKLDQAEGERVLTACSSRGHYFVPVRQFGQMYSFVREIDLGEIEEARFSWDGGNVISDAVAMSRLILPNSYSTEYGARIFDYDGGEQQVMPIPSPQRAFRLQATAREWMTTAEADELRDLLAQYWEARDELPDRVAHSIWHAEYLVSARWLDVIVPLIVVAFEALINTSRQLVSRQFIERVPRLTATAESPVSQQDCELMYSARSRWVHGSRVALYGPRGQRQVPGEGPTDEEQREALDRIARTRDGLRAVLRKAIREPEFRTVFASDDAIRERWPVDV